MRVIIFLCAILFGISTQAQKKVTFKAEDDTEITADLYEASPDAPVILLCHQAKSSRGEYKNIAPRFVEMGYTCLAIDQRSGETMNGVENETNNFAEERKQPTAFIYSEQDIVAGIMYLFNKYEKKVIVVGSSYSASQAMMVATNNRKVKAVIAFSPGEYFEDFKVEDAVVGIRCPVFVTGSKAEMPEVKKLASKIDPNKVSIFEPKGAGKHGASVLDPINSSDSEEYWKAVKAYIENLKEEE